MLPARARWMALVGALVLPAVTPARAQPSAAAATAAPEAPSSPTAAAAAPGSEPRGKTAGTPGQAEPVPVQSSRTGPTKSAKHVPPSSPIKGGKAAVAKAKPAPASSRSRGRARPAPRKAGSKPGLPNEAARRTIAGAPPEPPPNESPELRAMRELDEVLFPRAKGARRETGWASTSPVPNREPSVDTSGLPPSRSLESPPASEPTQDLSWLNALRLPDIPVRWEPAVVRYLEHYKNHPDGRQLVGRWIQKSGRYRQAIVRALRHYGMPEDILWLALVESAFNPEAYSHAGAAGLWQFMPATGRIYGLTVTRGIDERLDPARSTHAAVRHLQDLHRRFGSWELAFAAYNMGYGGLLASIRKYNTNDYWELRRLEAALPYETALYVPKIVAMAVVARNCDVFGCDTVTLDPEEPFDEVSVGPGVTLEVLAEATGERRERLARMNPQLRGSRTPPLEQAASPRPGWSIYVPRGKGTALAARLADRARQTPPWELHRVRWGESLDDVAAARSTTVSSIEQLNDLGSGEQVRPATTIFVPRARAVSPARPRPQGVDRPHATVSDQTFGYADRERLFYRVVAGDEIYDVARVTGTTVEEIRRWNRLDPRAHLQGGMWLELHVRPGQVGSDVRTFRPDEVRLMTRCSDEFFAFHEGQRGRARLEHTVAAGETWAKIAATYGLSVGLLERINHRGRGTALRAGEKVVVYAAAAKVPRPKSASDELDIGPGEAEVDDREPGAAQSEPSLPADPPEDRPAAVSTG